MADTTFVSRVDITHSILAFISLFITIFLKINNPEWFFEYTYFKLIAIWLIVWFVLYLILRIPLKKHFEKSKEK